MYSFGRDFDENLEIDNIFREYISKRNDKDFMDKVTEALSSESLEIQKTVFDILSSKLMPFVSAAVNAIESAGFLDMINAVNEKLIDCASKDACDAALGFYSQFEEYKGFVRIFGARRYLMEKICCEMIEVEFLHRINCI